MGIVEVEETTRAQINAVTVEWRARLTRGQLGPVVVYGPRGEYNMGFSLGPHRLNCLFRWFNIYIFSSLPFRP